MDFSGVYAIECAANSRVYIGSSVNIKKRFMEHKCLLRSDNHHSLLMQRAWNKYGESAFSVRALIRCSPEDRLFYEQIAIYAYDSANPSVGMNMTPIVHPLPPVGSFRGRKHTDESKRKISASRMGTPSWNKGVPCSKRGERRSESAKRNIADGVRSGRNAKITMDIAKDIRRMHEDLQMPISAICNCLGLSQGVVYRVVKNISWTEG